MKTSKRISAVIVKRIADCDGDTSYYGEYASKPTSDLFSINRRHTADCNLNSLEAKLAAATLGNALDHLSWEDDEARDLLSEHYTALEECNCDGSRRFERGTYEYFNPSSNYVDKYGDALPENTPEEVREYVAQDYKRMEDLNTGYWEFIGIKAEAHVVINDVVQEITSGGLWGIESDAPDEFESIEAEELSSLREQLEALGFSKRAIATAFKTVQHKGE